MPARRRGYSAAAASLLTFLCSGLLHEYNFSIHNARSYEPGRATCFFLLMGSLMIAEEAVLKAAVGRLGVESRVSRLVCAAPSPAIAIGLQLLVLPAFTPYFMRSWLGSGMLDEVSLLVPHVKCS